MKYSPKLICLVAFVCLVVYNHFDYLATAIPGQSAAKAAGGQEGAAGKQTLPGKMVFDDLERKFTAYAGDKGKAPFDHAQHARIKGDTCALCHHTNSEKLTEKMEEPVSKCAVCHKAEEGVSELEGTREGKTFKGKKAMNSEDAFHGGPRGEETIVGCIGCHKERNIDPKRCNNCHTGENQ
jgi:hypothetical protein